MSFLKPTPAELEKDRQRILRIWRSKNRRRICHDSGCDNRGFRKMDDGWWYCVRHLGGVS